MRILLSLCLPALLPALAVAGSPTPPAPAEDERFSFWSDFGESLSVSLEAFGVQFTDPTARTSLLLGGALTFATDRVDQDLFDRLDDNSAFDDGLLDTLGDDVALLSTVTTLFTYYLAQRMHDEKLRAFSSETFSAMTIVYVETLALSQFGFHERPRTIAGDEPTGFFDTGLRGPSSFPSGHILAPAILTLKTYDYYGWKPALVPAALTAITGLHRISNGSHFPSDIVGSLALAVTAHIATRKVNRERHPDALHWQVAPTGDGGAMVVGGFRF